MTLERLTKVTQIGISSSINLNAESAVYTGIVTATTFSGSGASLTTLDASELDSGTIPDARFPATLPAASGANLTNLPAANITGTLPAISGANLTNLPAANITGTLPAISGANLTNLPAANITGTLPAISGANLTNLPSDTPADTDVQVTYDISAPSSSAYRFTGPGYSGADDNPDIYLVRGQRYRFTNNSGGSHPFQIRSSPGGSAYTDGVSGSQSGTQDFNVQNDAPVRLYYQCTIHSGMIGNIYIVGASDWRMTDVATNATPEIYTTRSVGIGTVNPAYDLDVWGDVNPSASANGGGTTGNIRVVDTSAIAADTGGVISFSYLWSDPPGHLGNPPYIKAVKTSSATGNYGGGLAFGTRVHAGSQLERMRISEEGYVTKPNQPAFLVTGSFALTSWNGVYYPLWSDSGNAPTYDIGNHYSNGVFTAPVDGRYLFSAHFLTDNVSGYMLWRFYKNTSSYMAGWHQVYDPGTVANMTSMSGTQIIQLSQNDTVRIGFNVTHDGVYTPSYNYFMGYLLG